MKVTFHVIKLNNIETYLGFDYCMGNAIFGWESIHVTSHGIKTAMNPNVEPVI